MNGNDYSREIGVEMKKQLSMMLFLLTGCASHTGVVSMGKDTFMIAKQQATGFSGLGNIKAEIIVEGSSQIKLARRSN